MSLSVLSEVPDRSTHSQDPQSRGMASLRVDKARWLELSAKEERADQLDDLMHVLPAGVVLLTGTGVVKDANPAALALLGEPLLDEAWIDVIQRCFSPRADDGHEVSLKSGRRLNIATQPLSHAAGQIILLNDLTETRRLQERIGHYQRLSEMGRMVASLAHQIRTPLSAAMIYGTHLKQTDLDVNLRVRFAEKMVNCLTHLEQHVHDMLLFSRNDIKADEVCDLSELLAQLYENLEPLLESSKSSLAINLPASHQLHVCCHRSSLLGALSNLVLNAIEAIVHHADIRVESQLSEDEKTIELSICDNGPGFPNDLIERACEPFLTTKSTGTGLGLAVVDAVARAHGAPVKILSDQNGACVTLSLAVAH